MTAKSTKAEEKYLPRLTEIGRLHKKDLDKERERFAKIGENLSTRISEEADATEVEYNTSMDAISQKEIDDVSTADTTLQASLESIEKHQQDSMQQLKDRWNKEMSAFQEDVATQNSTNEAMNPPWSPSWHTRVPCTEANSQIAVGSFSVNLETLNGELPPQNEFPLHGESLLTVPLVSTLPNDASVLVSSSGKHRTESIKLLQNVMLRALTALPPGKAKCTLIDPVGLGQSFAGVLHLADFEESQLLDRAWTEPRHIETQLARLTEHMETVIQNISVMISNRLMRTTNKQAKLPNHIDSLLLQICLITFLKLQQNG